MKVAIAIELLFFQLQVCYGFGFGHYLAQSIQDYVTDVENQYIAVMPKGIVKVVGLQDRYDSVKKAQAEALAAKKQNKQTKQSKALPLANPPPSVLRALQQNDGEGDDSATSVSTIPATTTTAYPISPTLTELSANVGCDSLSQLEQDLYQAILDYRKTVNASQPDLSLAMISTSKIHVMALQETISLINNDDCCMHSWKGTVPVAGMPDVTYDQCCYNCNDPNPTAGCMWYKPREITGVGSMPFGYEIAQETNGNYQVQTADQILQVWKDSSSHNAVLISDGWSQWNYMGVAVGEQFAVAWFLSGRDVLGSCDGGKDMQGAAGTPVINAAGALAIVILMLFWKIY